MRKIEDEKLSAFEESAKQFELYLTQLGYVKAVKCKDCLHSKKAVTVFGMPETRCTHFDSEVYGDDWCSHGEAR